MSDIWQAAAAAFPLLRDPEAAAAGLMILQIVWIDLLLSGDNAVVIALAARGLPAHQRMLGIVLGAGVAVALRIVFTLGLQYGLELPYLKLLGALALLWIAVKLVIDEDGGAGSIPGSRTLLKAIRTIVIADTVMSLDNVLAIAAAARGHPLLIAFGLALSIPLIVLGASVIMRLLHKLPVLVWAGAALLGWIAGGLLAEEPALAPYLDPVTAALGASVAGGVTALNVLGALIVVGIGAIWPRSPRRAPPPETRTS